MRRHVHSPRATSVALVAPFALGALVALAASTSFESPARADQPAPVETKKKVTADKSADYVRVFGSHTKANSNDPVSVVFTKFSVRKVRFKSRKIVGSKAELVIDVTSLSSGNTKRDAHLKSKDLIDVEKRNQAVVSIVIKKRLENPRIYAATATVKLGTITKKWQVRLELLSTDKKAGTRFKVRHEFTRSDFGIGGAGGAVAEKLIAEAVLTIK